MMVAYIVGDYPSEERTPGESLLFESGGRVGIVR